MADVNTKICQYARVEKSLTVNPQGLDVISVSGELVSTKMVVAGHEFGGIVATKLVEMVDGEGNYCQKSAEGHIEWYRDKYMDFPTIVYTLIDNCRMVGYQIAAFGTDETLDGRLILDASFINQPGDIDSPEGILQHDPDTEYRCQQTQNRVVLGDRLALIIKLRPEPPEIFVEKMGIANAWWSTDYLCGGRVISVNGDYGDIGLTYTIDIMGKEQIAISSDFVDYEVGDWVFATHLGTIGRKCEWEEDERETGIAESAIWIILPIKISWYGA